MKQIKPKAEILVVDDAEDTIEVIERNLRASDYRVFSANSVAQATDFLERTSVDLVITDLKMPKVGGMELVRYVRENLANTEVMMITGYPSIQGAISAVKSGAEQYLAKPFTSEELRNTVEAVLDKLERRRKHEAASEFHRRQTPAGFIGESPAMQRVFQTLTRAAASRAPVLITGESGTGKELAARALHYGGPRASAPFVPVNCGGIPEALLESELFGHVKGSFTGAHETRAGFFQTANGGTIFLDEMSETSLAMQVKLLRVLQEGEVRMVGASRTLTVDVRVVAASNKDPMLLIKRGLLREDLYFRLAVIPLSLPALRDRSDDVLLLARHFLQRYCAEAKRTAPAFSDRALDVLRRYHWPGNVRELENVVHNLVVMTEKPVIDASDLPPPMRYAVPDLGGKMERSLADVEAQHIRNVLASVDGNKSHAARILGIDRKTLRVKLERYFDRDPDNNG